MSESPFNPSTPLSAPAGPSSPTGATGHPEQPLFVRPRAGRVVGGVCAGVAERTGIDPLLVRIGAVALVVASGVGILVYAALWMLTPSTDGPARVSTERLHGLAQRLTPRSVGGRTGRAALVIVAALAVLFASLLHDGSGFGALVVLLVLGLVLSSGWLRRIIAGLIAVVVALGVATAVWGSHLSTRAVTLNDAGRVDSSYRLPAGTLRLDLADLVTAPGATAVGTRAMVGTGDVVVTLPRQMSVHVRARSGFGAVHVLGATTSGFGPELVRDVPAAPGAGQLDLDLTAGTGTVTVRSAG